MRLIDADALIPKMNECVNDHYITDFDAIATILDAPTVEPNTRNMLAAEIANISPNLSGCVNGVREGTLLSRFVRDGN